MTSEQLADAIAQIQLVLDAIESGEGRPTETQATYLAGVMHGLRVAAGEEQLGA